MNVKPEQSSANELADWIKATNFYENIEDHFINDTMDEVETMLRQQQAEIEALKEAVLKTIPTLKWSEDLLREAGHDEAVSNIQDCIVALRLAIRKAQEK